METQKLVAKAIRVTDFEFGICSWSGTIYENFSASAGIKIGNSVGTLNFRCEVDCTPTIKVEDSNVLRLMEAIEIDFSDILAEYAALIPSKIQELKQQVLDKKTADYNSNVLISAAKNVAKLPDGITLEITSLEEFITQNRLCVEVNYLGHYESIKYEQVGRYSRGTTAKMMFKIDGFGSRTYSSSSIEKVIAKFKERVVAKIAEKDYAKNKEAREVQEAENNRAKLQELLGVDVILKREWKRNIYNGSRPDNGYYHNAYSIQLKGQTVSTHINYTRAGETLNVTGVGIGGINCNLEQAKIIIDLMK
jgi:hypothetical protein